MIAYSDLAFLAAVLLTCLALLAVVAATSYAVFRDMRHRGRHRATGITTPLKSENDTGTAPIVIHKHYHALASAADLRKLADAAEATRGPK